MATTQNGIAPPDDTLQSNNPPGLNGGLVNTATAATPAPPPNASLPPAPAAPSYSSTPATATGYTATPYSVPREGLVQEQVRQIVGDDSPLMQQARQRATQEANARGLVNSSITVGAGQQAVIAQALPMAQQDAQSYTNAATNTTNQQNAASQFTAGAQNTVGLANAQQENAARANNQQAAVQLANTRMNNEAQVAMANLDTQTRLALSTLDTQTRQLLQTNQSASNAYVQAVTNISNITTSNTMSQEAKDRAVQTQINLLNEQLRTIGTLAATTPAEVAELNLGDFFQVETQNGSVPTPGNPATGAPPPPAPNPEAPPANSGIPQDYRLANGNAALGGNYQGQYVKVSPNASNVYHVFGIGWVNTLEPARPYASEQDAIRATQNI